jgi:hypothetical protein
MKGVLHRIEADLVEGWANGFLHDVVTYLGAHHAFWIWCQLRGRA